MRRAFLELGCLVNKSEKSISGTWLLCLLRVGRAFPKLGCHVNKNEIPRDIMHLHSKNKSTKKKKKKKNRIAHFTDVVDKGFTVA